MDAPKINQKIEFKLLTGPYAAAYSTYVEDLDDRSLVVVRPTVGGDLLPLTAGDPVRIEYAIKGAARLAFQTRVQELDVRILPVVVVGLPETDHVERFQQRDFVRLDTSLKLTYTVTYSPDQLSRRSGVFESRTRDLSGNGAQILCTESYASGTRLDIYLDVNGTPVQVVGEVIRKVDETRKGEYWMGVRFVGLSERTRDLIIRYIFNEQRERRKMGLL